MRGGHFLRSAIGHLPKPRVAFDAGFDRGRFHPRPALRRPVTAFTVSRNYFYVCIYGIAQSYDRFHAFYYGHAAGGESVDRKNAAIRVTAAVRPYARYGPNSPDDAANQRSYAIHYATCGRESTVHSRHGRRDRVICEDVTAREGNGRRRRARSEPRPRIVRLRLYTRSHCLVITHRRSCERSFLHVRSIQKQTFSYGPYMSRASISFEARQVFRFVNLINNSEAVGSSFIIPIQTRLSYFLYFVI